MSGNIFRGTNTWNTTEKDALIANLALVQVDLDDITDHNNGIVLTYPELVAPVSLTAGGGAWDAYPAPTEVVPLNGISSIFDLHWVHVSAISANGNYMLRLYQGAALSETLIAEVPFARNAVHSQEGTMALVTPLIAANTRISAALSSSNAAADTCEVKVTYQTY